MKARKKNKLLLLICFVLLIIFFIALSNGAASVGKIAFWQALVDFDGSKQSHQIIRNIRLLDRKSTRLNSSHRIASRMPSSA